MTAVSDPRAPTTDQLSALCSEGRTGILEVEAAGWASGQVYLLGGMVVACSEAHEAARYERLLIASGAASAEQLDALRGRVDAGEDLADLLAAEKSGSGEAIQQAGRALFLDNLHRLVAAAAPRLEFQEQDAVFPPNMQFGLDTDSLLAELVEWRERCREALDGRVLGLQWKARGDVPDGIAPGTWEELRSPGPAASFLPLLGPDLRRSTERAQELLSARRIVPADATDDLTSEDEAFAAADTRPVPTTPDAEDALLSLDVDQSAEADDPFDPDQLDLSDFDLDFDEAGLDGTELDAVRVDDSTGAIEPADAEAPGPQDGLTENDYELAAQGHFIKSYEVLDKVDLTGVDVIGAGPAADEDGIHHGEIEALEALESLDGVEIEGAEHPDDRTFDHLDGLEVSRGPMDDSVLAAGEDYFTDLGQDGDSSVLEIEDVDASGSMRPPTAPATEVGEAARELFTEEQLKGFGERVGTFNQIFRVIFDTFAAHIGEQRARRRFNALLGSSKRQHPELFSELQVEEDGAVPLSALIDNLAACPPGDYGARLHQGLYELIFSHLYDAKDMLPGEAEATMMERVVFFERKLQE